MSGGRQLSNLDIDQARASMRNKWREEWTSQLGVDDAYTDGFYDGRLWAFKRIVHLIQGKSQEAARRLLRIYGSEISYEP